MRITIAALLFLASSLANASPPDYLSMNGEQLYKRFCAVCHGTRGYGDGPVAATLRNEVPDLSTLAHRAGGKFPRDRVVQIIDGRFILAEHGTRTMPIWGEDLSHLYVGDPDGERSTQLIITRLTDYLESIQRNW